jgi:hypothetical protein
MPTAFAILGLLSTHGDDGARVQRPAGVFLAVVANDVRQQRAPAETGARLVRRDNLLDDDPPR